MVIKDRATVAPASAPRPGRFVGLLPGLLVAGVAAGGGYLVNHWFGAVSPLVVAIMLGILLTASGGYRPWLQPGLRFAATMLLRIGLVLLGLQLVLSDVVDLGVGPLVVVVLGVAVSFVATRWVGARLGLSAERSLLVATGVAICGASAVAAMNQVGDGEEEDVVTAVAVVTVLGTLSMVALPVLGMLLGLDEVLLGLWVGASVHEVGQVVAIGGAAGAAALSAAVVVKLFRVLLLAPLVALVAIGRRAGRRTAGDAGKPPILPWFVVGFVAAAALRSTGWLPSGVLDVGTVAGTILLAAAMFALGAAVDLRAVARGGRRALTVGAVGTVVLSTVTLAGLVLTT
ncbi:putative integral membrane protein (TIGR00698 family) [Micromonospora profundi]|uniref:YeiH family protein n=1 Tax=Micromonospora profundi TaxID=1420889 RepID=UPI00143C431D|nr:putative sulfate exporter family transporter [Micromonospora profundi]NJC12982.1 putative integral membrane protein (TIGR00698 family) [Micromonospora profundi]